MGKHKISIIVPVYNVEKYLHRCLDSLINQTLKEIEIILIDDESPDNSPKICDSVAIQEPRINVIHKNNGGLGFARNAGLEVASGEFVAFVDSDDYVDVNMYKRMYDLATKHALDTVFCGYNNVDKDLRINAISEVEQDVIIDKQEFIQDVLYDMIACDPSSKNERKYRMSVWHAIYSRNIVSDKIRFLSEREYISEDIIFHVQYLTKAKKIAFIPDNFYFYCYNEVSLTKSFRSDRFEKQKKLYHELFFQLKSLRYNEGVFKLRVERFFIGYVRDSLRSISNARIPYKNKRDFIKEIVYDKIWKNLQKYPTNQMTLKHRVVILLINKKMIDILIFLFRIL